MARKEKEFQHYIIESNPSHISQTEYSENPAIAFLSYAIDAKDSMIACINSFRKGNGSKKYTNPAIHSLQHISAALLPSMMGHFETFQRNLFATSFEYTGYYKKFDPKSFISKLNKERPIEIDIVRLSTYRGLNAPVGLVIADALPSWSNPLIVNKYFSCFGGNQQFYSNDDILKLRILWQLRHSIVHTAGTVTIPDAHKVDELKEFGGKNIVLDSNFIKEVARKFHPMIKGCMERFELNFKGELRADLPVEITEKINELFKVESKCPTWFG